MKIVSLKVTGFRSLAQIDWAPADLNLLIGPNASGKSNLLRLLDLLVAAAQGGLGKHVQREGGIEPLLWDGSANEIGVCLRTSPLEQGREIRRDSLTYKLRLARLGLSSFFRVEQEFLGNDWQVWAGLSDQPLKLFERRQQHAVVYDENEHGLAAPGAMIPETESLLSLAAGPFSQNHRISKYQQELAAWTVYQDLHTDREAEVRRPVVASSTKQVAPDGQNLVSVLHTLYTGDRSFKKEVNTAMLAAFGDEFEELLFPPAADQRIQMRVRWRSLSREQSTADLSDGTLRFLFLLAVLANPEPPPLVAIDEPETGLHPSMFPIVAEYARDAATRTQIVFTTHSPAFLDAFGKQAPAVTVVDWQGGKSVFRVLSGENLERWLEQYSLGEVYRSGELESAV